MIQPLGSFFEHLADFFFYIDASLDSLQSRGVGGYALTAFIAFVSIFKRRKPRVFPNQP
jgi:hypothetical protein